MRRLLPLLALTLLALPGQGNAPAALDHVRVWDGTRMLEAQRLSLRDGHVHLEPSGGPCRFTVLPGFIDCHVHLALSNPARVVAGGVTTVRDLGWDPQAILQLKARLKGRPHMVVAGPMLCAPGGYPCRAGWCPAAAALPVESAAAARQAVDGLAGRVGVIKVALEPRAGPTLPLETLKAVVDAAHRHHLRVTAHVSGRIELQKCLDAGVDELAHFLFDDEPVSDALIGRMVAAGMVVCPTLHVNPSPQRLDNLRRFTARGGRIVYGTDLGNAGPPPGIDLEELRLMARAGLSPAQILTAATSAAADELNLPTRGRLGEGAPADLIVVEGNPLENLDALGNLTQVRIDGEAI